jgi:cytochrome P450
VVELDAAGFRWGGGWPVLPVIPQIFQYTATAMSRELIAPGSWGAAIYDGVDEGLVTAEEAFLLLTGITVAAMDTTIHALGSAVWLLATHPTAWQSLRDDPALAGRVFEEVLRFESPVAFFARGATRDTALGGTPIRAGDRVITLLGSANRDERHFAGADRFDINRTPNDHVAFGHGIHSCAGQGVARLEGAAVLASLARRVERIEPAGEPARHFNNTVRGLASLPVTLVGVED